MISISKDEGSTEKTHAVEHRSAQNREDLHARSLNAPYPRYRLLATRCQLMR